MPVPAAVERVREHAGPDATIAHAPGSVELLGETCAATGGMLLATALPESVAVALEPNDTGELIVASTRIGDETPLPMPDAIPAGYPAEVTAVAAAVVALQHTMHLIPRTGAGVTVRWASTIPVGPGYQVPLAQEVTRTLADAGLGEDAAVVTTVGVIVDATQAETILATGQAHAVSIGRAAPG